MTYMSVPRVRGEFTAHCLVAFVCRRAAFGLRNDASRQRNDAGRERDGCCRTDRWPWCSDDGTCGANSGNPAHRFRGRRARSSSRSPARRGRSPK